ncbi:hypothetical protein F4680DRAFT_470608 [Xylaria scruposa]|nr:hypothetical protein F4680DRAFT_470608 [Xylaria scruposa]
MATTTSAVAHDAFRHQQLPDPQNHFRLLRVTKHAPQATVTPQQEHIVTYLECELTTWVVADAPLYRAVSYTWGDPKDTAYIRVNGKSMQVRQNCKDVLRQVHRHSGPDSYFWVDSICINQTDHYEKNIQVAMIGAIFQKAELVLACLGAHDEYSRALVQYLKQHSKLLQQASTYYSVPKTERKSDRVLEWRVLIWHIRQKPDQLIRMFFEFLCRPYFQRMWTLPELRLARSVEILCGDDSVLAPVLFGLSLLVARGLDQYEIDHDTVSPLIAENRFSVRHVPKAIKTLLFFLSTLNAVRQTPLIRLFPLWLAAFVLQQQGHEHLSHLYLDSAHGRLHHGHLVAMAMNNSLRDPLWDTLQFTLKLRCEKPRDRVYAILAIVDWSSGAAKPIQPDYNGDVYDLLKAVLPWLWSTHGSAHSNADTSFKQCRRIIDALQLNIQSSPKLVREIDLRRHVNLEKITSETTTGSLLSNSVVGLSGFQVLSEDGILRLDTPPYWPKNHETLNFQPCLLLPPQNQNKWTAKNDRERDELILKAQKASEQFYVVFDKYNRICALLPRNAQAGDWIIADREASATLVLREQADGRFYIVGEAVVDLPFFHCLSEVGTKFLITFDIDDFIVLCACTQKDTWLSRNRIEDFLVRLGNGVCYAPGSSCAVKH